MTPFVVQSLSCVLLLVTPWIAICQASLSFTISQNLLKLTSIELVAIQPSHLCRPFLLLPSIFASIRVFSNELALCIRWPKYWSLSLNEYSGLISSRIDQFYLLVVKGLSGVFSSSTIWKHQFFSAQPFFMKHITSHKNQQLILHKNSKQSVFHRWETTFSSQNVP